MSTNPLLSQQQLQLIAAIQASPTPVVSYQDATPEDISNLAGQFNASPQAVENALAAIAVASPTGPTIVPTTTTPVSPAPTSPGARQDSSGDNASGRRFLFLFLDKRFVRSGVEQGTGFGGVAELHLDQPARAVRIGVNGFGLVPQYRIRFHDIAARRSIDFADGFHGFDGAKNLPGSDFRPSRGQLDEHDIAQFVLRVIGDADRCDIALHFNPFVLFGVTKLCWIRHSHTPSEFSLLHSSYALIAFFGRL